MTKKKCIVGSIGWWLAIVLLQYPPTPRFLRRRHRKLLLWPRTSNEASSHTDDPQLVAELRPVQKDGDLCKFIEVGRSFVFNNFDLKMVVPREIIEARFFNSAGDVFLVAFVRGVNTLQLCTRVCVCVLCMAKTIKQA